MKFGGGVDEEGRKIWIGFRDILHAHEFAAKEHYCRLRAGSFLIHCYMRNLLIYKEI